MDSATIRNYKLHRVNDISPPFSIFLWGYFIWLPQNCPNDEDDVTGYSSLNWTNSVLRIAIIIKLVRIYLLLNLYSWILYSLVFSLTWNPKITKYWYILHFYYYHLVDGLNSSLNRLFNVVLTSWGVEIVVGESLHLKMIVGCYDDTTRRPSDRKCCHLQYYSFEHEANS